MLNEIFKRSLSISCDDKKRQLQDIVFKHVGLPLPKTFQAVTPYYLEHKSEYPLFEQFYNQYQNKLENSILKIKFNIFKNRKKNNQNITKMLFIISFIIYLLCYDK